LSRTAKKDTESKAIVVVGDPTTPGPWLEQLTSCDTVIHLAGEPVAQRWTKAARRRIRDSRVLSTTLLAETLAKAPSRADGSPKVFIVSSGVGYYGSYRENATEFTENDLPGSGFLADVCVEWERAATPAATAGVRVANMRTGMVLAKEGGALPQMAKPFRWHVGGVMGSGKQWVSWIHIDDMAGLILFVLDHTNASGPVNAVAPESITNWGFTQALAKSLHRRARVSVPTLGLRLLLGEMSELATHGQRVVPTKAQQWGYTFRYPLLEDALKAIYGH
jgi:uncharacterized protein